MDTHYTKNIPLSSNNIQLRMETKTLAVRILAVVSNHTGVTDVVLYAIRSALYSEN